MLGNRAECAKNPTAVAHPGIGTITETDRKAVSVLKTVAVRIPVDKGIHDPFQFLQSSRCVQMQLVQPILAEPEQRIGVIFVIHDGNRILVSVPSEGIPSRGVLGHGLLPYLGGVLFE
ncbi:hypothetical protein D3C80_1439540 [compost metagenome]